MYQSLDMCILCIYWPIRVLNTKKIFQRDLVNNIFLLESIFKAGVLNRYSTVSKFISFRFLKIKSFRMVFQQYHSNVKKVCMLHCTKEIHKITILY